MATYYVDNANGSDASDGLSEANAWATIDKAMNTVAAGDKVWVQGGTDYTETATMDTVGTTTAWIVFEGYTSTTGDGGKATIDGASTRANGITSSLAATYYRFENLIFENHTGNGFNTITSDALLFVNCEFNNNGGRGAECDNVGVFIDCTATGNTGDGFGSDVGGRYISCTAHNNSGDGFQGDSGATVFYNCISSSNSLNGFIGQGSGTSGAMCAFNCTVDGDGKDTNIGFDESFVAAPVVLVNCIAYDCTTGIEGHSTTPSAAQIGRNNLVNGNTTAYTVWDPTSTDVTSAPGFTNEANQDYTLAGGSAARNAGADNSGTSSPGMDIGAHQSADAGGGSGIIKMAGDGGGMVG